MRVIALPNSEWPPAADALDLADAVIESPAELVPDLFRRIQTRSVPFRDR